jgi:peroxiredoxin
MRENTIFAVMLAALIAIVVAGGISHAAVPVKGTPKSRVVLGKAAPQVSGPTLSGGRASLASYRGKYVLLMFWAAWCPDCRTELPNVIAADRDVSGKRFAVLTYSVDKEKTLAMLKEWVTSMDMKFPVIYDGKGAKGKVPTIYGIRYIPTIYMVDPKGRIIIKNVHGEAMSRVAKRLTEVGDRFKPIDVTATLIDKKPTADGIRVQVAVSNPEGGKYGIRLEVEYTPAGSEKAKYDYVRLTGRGTKFTGEATVPVPKDALDISIQPGVYSAVLDDYVYGDAVLVENEEPPAK